MTSSLSHIINGCRKANPKSQRALFDLFNKKLYGVAVNYMHDREEAKEVLQESWIQIFKSINSYTDEGLLEGWLKTIVIRVCWKSIRKHKTVSIEDYHEVPIESISEQIYNKMTCEELLGLVKFIPVNSRTVFTMYVIDQFSHKEIAHSLDIEVSTSRAHLSRARKLLREKYFSMNQITQNGTQ